MTTQRSDVALEPTGSDSPAVPGDVVRRATLLCHRAEPHTGPFPCPSHVSEATRQLLRGSLRP